MSMTQTLASPPPFPAHARQVVRALRGAFSEAVASVGADPQDPQSIRRRLDLNKNLAWKIAKIVQTDDPQVVLQQMPGGPGLKIFLRAAEQAGADAARIQAAREAIDAFDEFVEVHCGDRTTMEMLGSTLSATADQQAVEQHRKLLFQGASYVWGVQARANLKIGVVGPGREDGLLDFASVNAFVDFRRLRPDVSWQMAARHSNFDDGSPMATSASEAIDLRYAAPDQAPLMADFCSNPLPQLRRHDDGTHTSFELVEGPVGNTGALTCVVGAIQRDIPYRRTREDDWGEHAAHCDTPAEVFIVDLFVHEQLTFAIPPEASLFSRMSPALPRERCGLPLHERLQDLGAGPLPVATPEVRQYNPLVQSVFDRMGWSPDAFRGFRVKIAYPACPTVLVLRYRLP